MNYNLGDAIKIWHYKAGWVRGTIHDVGRKGDWAWLEIDAGDLAHVVYLDADGYSPLVAPPF